MNKFNSRMTVISAVLLANIYYPSSFADDSFLHKKLPITFEKSAISNDPNILTCSSSGHCTTTQKRCEILGNCDDGNAVQFDINKLFLDQKTRKTVSIGIIIDNEPHTLHCESAIKCTSTQKKCEILENCKDEGGNRGGTGGGTVGGGGVGGGGGGSSRNPDENSRCWNNLYSTNARNANLSRDWGWRQMIGGKWDFHAGWDIGMAGQTDVAARFIADGIVFDTGSDGSRGNYVIYELADSRVVAYYHLASVSVGKTHRGKAGELVGVVGDTGSGGSIHLHVMYFKDISHYQTYISKIGSAKDEYEKRDLSIQHTIDPANIFSTAVCAFPNTVTTANDGGNP